MIGKVEHIKIGKKFEIRFDTEHNISINTMLYLIFKDKKRYFNVSEYETRGDYITVKALETGYYDTLYNTHHNKDFDFRVLIGLKLFVVDDPEEKKKINKESRYC